MESNKGRKQLERRLEQMFQDNEYAIRKGKADLDDLRTGGLFFGAAILAYGAAACLSSATYVATKTPHQILIGSPRE